MENVVEKWGVKIKRFLSLLVMIAKIAFSINKRAY